MVQDSEESLTTATPPAVADANAHDTARTVVPDPHRYAVPCMEATRPDVRAGGVRFAVSDPAPRPVSGAAIPKRNSPDQGHTHAGVVRWSTCPTDSLPYLLDDR